MAISTELGIINSSFQVLAAAAEAEEVAGIIAQVNAAPSIDEIIESFDNIVERKKMEDMEISFLKKFNIFKPYER